MTEARADTRQSKSPAPTPTAQAMVLAYRRHEAWARRSGYAAMEWTDFKASRLANPLSRAALCRSTGSAA